MPARSPSKLFWRQTLRGNAPHLDAAPANALQALPHCTKLMPLRAYVRPLRPASNACLLKEILICPRNAPGNALKLPSAWSAYSFGVCKAACFALRPDTQTLRPSRLRASPEPDPQFGRRVPFERDPQQTPPAQVEGLRQSQTPWHACTAMVSLLIRSRLAV
ncbi:hypothetical protein BU16DRAFT_367872 [Lophium mytilinum]|uniref:Uncharacterized protein n=1 Tax=Lophium mytilinum TaxID=390894 RepID=A0A6A6QYL0_9PEZI|nr:hypothetical protein BU16DRAFT_367872 [Lophium mytilinum]